MHKKAIVPEKTKRKRDDGESSHISYNLPAKTNVNSFSYIETFVTYILLQTSCCCKRVLSWCLSFCWSLHSVFSSDYLSQLHHNVLHCCFLIGHIVPRNLHNVSPTWVVGHDFLQSSCDTVTNCCPKLLAELHQPLICVINDFLQSITKFRTTLAQGLLDKKRLFQELQ